MATSWFNYNGGPNNQPTSYSAIGGNPNCPAPKEILCAIFAEVQLISGVERPIITGALQTEINNAISEGEDSTNVRLKPN